VLQLGMAARSSTHETIKAVTIDPAWQTHRDTIISLAATSQAGSNQVSASPS
jgi:hypothetical protein